MDKTVILCHFSKETIKLWDRVLNEKLLDRGIKDGRSLVENFLNNLKKLSSSVFFSFENESGFSSFILEKYEGEKTILPYSHEILLIKNIFKNDDIQDVYYFDSIFPLMDLELSKKLLEIHQEYQADYSFNENLPEGITGVFFGRSLFEALTIEKNESSESTEIDESIPDTLDGPLRSYVEKNINHFHVEVNFEHPDLRLLRLDFSCKSMRSLRLTCDFYEKLKTGKEYYNNIDSILSREPEILNHFPSYLEIEIFGDCEYKCTFCPRQFIDNPTGQKMTKEDIKELINFTKEGFDDTTISLGGLGEPLQNPESGEIIKELLLSDHIPSVILETNGLYLDKLLSLAEIPQIHKARFVVNINSLTSYESIHGTTSENKKRVMDNLKTFSNALGNINPLWKKNIYIQTLKIQENESELDEIYGYAEELGVSFLLQKYNSYAHLMPEKRVSDMTPLERSFCWHLRRDLYIRANKDIAFCKQDIKGESLRGNFKNTPLNEVWSTLKPDWKNNYLCQYPQKPDCINCDEYFTFNM